MAESYKALVKPELLRWARDSAGLAPEAAAMKAGVSPDRLLAWEDGSEQATMAQLRKLAAAYRRPLAVFYLPAPPKDFEALHDFRRLAAGQRVRSPALVLAIREARERREAALELYRELSEPPTAFTLAAGRHEKPEAIAVRARFALGVELGDQRRWRDPGRALRSWRAALEALGLLVFQFPGVELQEARGFSISERELPVVGINAKDSPNGRVFTVMHELAHLMLRGDALCDRHDEGLELFCNRVAADILVPREGLLAEPVVVAHSRDQGHWSQAELRELSRVLSVSEEVILRRLRELRLCSEAFFRSHLAVLQRRSFVPAKGGHVPVPLKTISQLGRSYVGLVFEALARDVLTTSEVAGYLGVRTKHFPDIQHELGRS